MSEKRPLEHCCGCDQPTGRAGRADDSIYCPDCDSGPWCEECWLIMESEWPEVCPACREAREKGQ